MKTRTQQLGLAVCLALLAAAVHGSRAVAAKPRLLPLNFGRPNVTRIDAQSEATALKAAWDRVTLSHSGISKDVDYGAIRHSAEWRSFRQVAANLQSVDLSTLHADTERIAFWLNVYNVLVSDGVVSLNVHGSVLNTPDFFQRATYDIGGSTFSLNDIEHGILRANAVMGSGRRFPPGDPRLRFVVSRLDPRIHFALNCGSHSCPPVHFYDPAHLNEQLDAAATNFVNGPDVRIDRSKNRIMLSEIFRWYGSDFGTNDRDALRFIEHYLRRGPARSYLATHWKHVSVQYLPYDWSLAEIFG